MSKDYLIFKIIIIGDSSVGKTSFLLRFCDGKFDADSITTIGIDHKVKFISRQEKRIQLQIWDTAGQERFRSLSKTMFKGSDGILLMYDISKYETFKDIKNWINDIKTNIGVPIEKIALIIIGNKSDLPDDEKKVDQNDVENLEKTTGFKIIEASAKNEYNLGLLRIVWLLNPSYPFKTKNGFEAENLEDIIHLILIFAIHHH